MATQPHTDRHAAAVAAAVTLANRAHEYADLLRKGRRHGEGVLDYAWLELCNAAIRVADDGDFMAEREAVCHDLGCDPDGFPLDADGFAVPDFPRERVGAAVFGAVRGLGR